MMSRSAWVRVKKYYSQNSEASMFAKMSNLSRSVHRISKSPSRYRDTSIFHHAKDIFHKHNLYLLIAFLKDFPL